MVGEGGGGGVFWYIYIYVLFCVVAVVFVVCGKQEIFRVRFFNFF